MISDRQQLDEATATRTVTLPNGTRCVCTGPLVRSYREFQLLAGRERPWPSVVVSCTYGDEAPRPLRFEVGWSHWDDERLIPTLEANAGIRTVPRSQEDAPDSVEPRSIVEAWDPERAYCRSIRWRAQSRGITASLGSPGWGWPLGGAIYVPPWTARYDADPHSSETAITFVAPTERWWSSAGVVRTAIQALERG